MRTLLGQIGLFSVLLGCAGLACAEQIMLNPEFQQLDGATFAAWRPNGPVEVSDIGRSGRCAKLGPEGRVLQCFPLDKGYTYRGTVWARGSGQFSVAFYVYRDGPGANYAGGENSGPIQVGTEWKQYLMNFAPGNAETELKGACFAVGAGKDAAEVFIDDATLEKSPLPTASPNLLLNSELADADGDGIADHWRGEKRRLRLEAGPGNVKALRAAATLFSEDYQPKPDFKDWWNWNRWGEQHGSGWPALPRPLGGAYTVLLESEPVAVRPGQRYDVSMLLRHLQVWGEFVAVRWFNAERKPIAEFEERIGYYHISHGNTSDWTRYVGRVTSPQVARYAAIAVGCKLSSGTIWMTQPSLTEGLGLPNKNEPRSEWIPSEVKQGVPLVEETGRRAAAVPKTTKAGVAVTDEAIEIGLSNGVYLTLPLREKQIVGITSVVCGNTLLRNPHAPPIAPVIQTAPARDYVACVYESHTESAQEVVIHTSLRTASGETDELDWLLRPITQDLAGRRHQGVRYGYRFQSAAVTVRRIMDRATWELGGTPLGLHVGSHLLSLTESSTYCLECAYRFVGADSFDYQTGKEGTLVSFFDRCDTSLFCRGTTPNFLILQDTFLFPESSEASTSMKIVLFCEQPGDADHWTQLRDDIYAYYRKQLGAPPEKPLQPAAMFIGYSGLRGIGDLRPENQKIENAEYYRWVADNAVPRLAAQDFKRVMMVLPRGPWNWPVNDINHLCPETVEPFKYLCDAARKRGMTVISWYGSVQNLDGASAWKEHPEFILRTASGERSRTYYSPWGWPGKLEAGFARYTLAGLKEARERTGLGGLWLDSYCSATHLMDTASFADVVRQADGLLPWHAEIEKMGYYTYCEGAPHGLGTISDGGWNPPEDWETFRPETLYKEGLYLQQPWGKSSWPHEITDMGRFLADPDKCYYYRMLANFCCPILDMGHFGTDKAAMQRIAQANHDFNAVSDLMQRRHLLSDRGVEWISPAGRAIFAFAEMNYAVPLDIQSVEDVTAKEEVSSPKGRSIKLQKYHTYRLTKK